jgi:hypothetical protein
MGRGEFIHFDAFQAVSARIKGRKMGRKRIFTGKFGGDYDN